MQRSMLGEALTLIIIAVSVLALPWFAIAAVNHPLVLGWLVLGGLVGFGQYVWLQRTDPDKRPHKPGVLARSGVAALGLSMLFYGPALWLLSELLARILG